jgi:hypothetical protein
MHMRWPPALSVALYIYLVEQPARLKLGSRAMMKELTLSNRRGTLVMSGLAAISAVLAFVEWKSNGDIRWLIGGVCILAS